MPQLWEWTAVDQHNRPGKFQTVERAGIASEAGMLEHLKRSFPYYTITGLRRITPKEHAPPVGPISRHAYQSGVWDQCMVELGHAPATTRRSIVSEFRRAQLAKVSGVPKERITLTPIRRRLPSLVSI